MKRFLLPLLICPACLPKEQPLELSAAKEADGDLLTGVLRCRKCRRDFPIKGGVATLLRDPTGGPSGGQWKYEESETLNRYLWSHFADLCGDPDVGSAYRDWADCLVSTGGVGFDAGCAVGRLAFEMAARFDFAVGCDLSATFIGAARKLAKQRHFTCSLPLEGNLRETFSGKFPDHWRTDNVEFIIADAQALPFARECFSQVASLNLLDRVHTPLAHLHELNRVAAGQNAHLLCSDPYSWSTANTPEQHWLGGTIDGPYQGRGLDNVRGLLEGKSGILTPPWRVTREGNVEWRLRTHRNHYEVLRSQLLAAVR